jgi:hypothetical protein
MSTVDIQSGDTVMAGAIINGPALEALEASIATVNTGEARDIYRAGDFPRADKVKDLDTRFRWDLFWAVQGMTLLDHHGVDISHVKHSHIDTALRKIVAPLR